MRKHAQAVRCCLPAPVKPRSIALSLIVLLPPVNCEAAFPASSPVSSPVRASFAMGFSLPWEVLERMIDLSGDHCNVLRGFSLTCQQLLPRSRWVLFSRLDFKNRERVFAFVDFLDDNPHLKAVVRSVMVRPDDFAPFPLLYILPNLSEIRFKSGECLIAAHILPTIWHQSSLACSQRFGANIRTLHLSCLSFATYLPFARALLAFTSVRHLTCTHVVINTAGDQAPLGVIKRRLSEQMQLKTLTVSASRSLSAPF